MYASGFCLVSLSTVSLSTPSDASQFIVMESELDGTEQQDEEHSGDAKDPRARVLTTVSLLAFCFFAICGGPMGSQDVITGALCRHCELRAGASLLCEYAN